MFTRVCLQGWKVKVGFFVISQGFYKGGFSQGWIFTRLECYKVGKSRLEMEMSRLEMESQCWKVKVGKKVSRLENKISTVLQGWKSRLEMDFENNPTL